MNDSNQPLNDNRLTDIHAYDAPNVYVPPIRSNIPLPSTGYQPYTPPQAPWGAIRDEWVELRRAIAQRYQDDAITLEQAILATQQLRGK